MTAKTLPREDNVIGDCSLHEEATMKEAHGSSSSLATATTTLDSSMQLIETTKTDPDATDNNSSLSTISSLEDEMEMIQRELKLLKSVGRERSIKRQGELVSLQRHHDQQQTLYQRKIQRRVPPEHYRKIMKGRPTFLLPKF